MPGPFVPLVVGVEILMVASSGPPTVNIQATCQASERAIIEAFGSAIDTFDHCMRQQNEALEQIKKDWATYPAAAKTLCVQPRAYSPSYVEWLTCFEMDQQVREIRAKAAADAKANARDAKANARRQSPNSRTGSETKHCPAVQFRADGTVASVINC